MTTPAHIPKSPAEWKERVEHYGLDKVQPTLRLRDIRDQSLRPAPCRPPKTSLSGSTMKEDDFLFLRAIWPGLHPDPSAGLDLAALQEAGLIRAGTYTQAIHRIGLRLGLDGKLAPATDPPHARVLGHDPPSSSPPVPRSLMGEPAAPSTNPSEPSTPVRTAAAAPSGPAISHAPKKVPVQSRPEADSSRPPLLKFIDTMSSYPSRGAERDKLDIFFNAFNNFTIIFDHLLTKENQDELPLLDFNRPEPSGGWSTPKLDSSGSDLSDMSSLAIADDTPSKVPATDPLSRRVNKQQDPAPAGRAARRISDSSAAASDDDGDKPRSTPPDETIITIFAANLFDSLSCVVHPSNGHSMLPFRVQYTCSPKASKGQDSAYFNAAVDAIVLTRASVSDHHASGQKGLDGFANANCLILSEFKRHPYESSEIAGRVEIQEAAEVAAYLSTQHNTGREHNGAQRILLLSQYRSDVFLTIAQSGRSWLDYICEESNSPAFKTQDGGHLGQQDMLCLQRIGRYNLQLSQDMYRLSSLLAAVLVTDKLATSAR